MLHSFLGSLAPSLRRTGKSSDANRSYRTVSKGSVICKTVAALAALLIFGSENLDLAHAASKARGIKKSELVAITVSITIKNKVSQKKVTCYKGTGGQAGKNGKTLTFKSFSKLVAEARKAKAKKAKIALLQALKTASGTQCKHEAPNPNNIPDYLSLKPYTGTFGEAEARVLFDRFSFGASPERIQLAVADGLETTITKLTTFVAEPGLDAAEANMRCNGLLPGDPRNGTQNYTCDATDPNDLDFGGITTAVMYKMWYSQNGFFNNLFFFLHNRFQSVNITAAANQNCTRWSALPHIEILRKASQSGDYVQFLRDFGNDYLGAIIWLHLLDSNKVKPNEDEAREILQLGGTGAINLDGTPVYGDVDVAQCALALTGWVDSYYDDAYDNRICVPAYSSVTHAPGPHRIFIGTPYEKQVTDLNTVVDAIVAHPRLGERIAENIYDEYINPFADPAAIRALASEVRSNNYNLVATLKTVMRSQALYAPKSRKSIPKHPIELMLGFLRQTGMPLTGDYYQLRNLMDSVGQVPMNPGTVFGWSNRDSLAGEGYVLERRRAIVGLLQQNIEDLGEKGFTYWDRFLAGIPADANASAAFIDRVSKYLNVTLNPAQKAAIDQFLNYNQGTCNQYTNCSAGQTKYLSRNQFDAAADSEDEGRESGSYKTRGAIAMIAMLPEYMMK